MKDKGMETMLGESSNPFRGLDWEGLSEGYQIDSIDAPDILLENIAKAEIKRDDSYKITGKITGLLEKDINEEILFGNQIGVPMPLFNFQGTDYLGNKYELRSCYVVSYHPVHKSRLSSRYFIDSERHIIDRFFEIDIKPQEVRRVRKNLKETCQVIDWYLNAPQESGILFYRVTETSIVNKYIRRKRDTEDSEISITSDGLGGGSMDHIMVQLDDYKFAVRIIDEFDPLWSKKIGIEYNVKWGKIPAESERESISELLSFLIGRHLLYVGRTEFDSEGKIIQQVAVNPWGNNVRSTCEETSQPPIEFNLFDHKEKFEQTLQSLLPNYLSLRESLQLNEALWRLWVAYGLPLGVDLPLIANGIEII